jgi:hypothetical protein
MPVPKLAAGHGALDAGPGVAMANRLFFPCCPSFYHRHVRRYAAAVALAWLVSRQAAAGGALHCFQPSKP